MKLSNNKQGKISLKTVALLSLLTLSIAVNINLLLEKKTVVKKDIAENSNIKCNYSLPVVNDWQPRQVKNLSDRKIGIFGASIQYKNGFKTVEQTVLVEGLKNHFIVGAEDFKLKYKNLEFKQVEGKLTSNIPPRNAKVKMSVGQVIKGTVSFIVPENIDSFTLEYESQETSEKVEFDIFTKMPVAAR